MTENKSDKKKFVILFDGNCQLCNNVARFITGKDSRNIFCFIPLESEKAQGYLNLNKNENLNNGTVLLIKEEKIYRKSDAVLHILKYLDGLWPLLYVLIIIPRFIRDPVYDMVARQRYEWFGSCTDCQDSRPC